VGDVVDPEDGPVWRWEKISAEWRVESGKWKRIAIKNLLSGEIANCKLQIANGRWEIG
jgi:hypothetical protein